MGRHSAGITANLKEKFLAAFADCGVVRKAAEQVGINERTHRWWLSKSASYRKQFKLAEERAIQAMEAELHRRAVLGSEEPVFFQGQQVGTTRRYSDILLIFLLKSKRPDVYRDYRETKVTGGLNNSLTVTVVHELHDSPAALPPPTSYTPALPPAPNPDDSDQ
jgi:hypothetical protein